ncbi:MAG TPA: HAD-IIA family hydrolase [Acidimicrobiales bacterium]|nr:HAD-IIA family hydrolase [Acidimicrobiales bacterium]
MSVSGECWVLDLDGVVWLADRPIHGSPGAVERARRAGVRILFVTNNSSMTVVDYLAKLDRMGVPTETEDLVTSAQAAASLLDRGSTALSCAGAGVTEALAERGVELREEGPVDTVVVGWHRTFDFAGLNRACQAVWSGARLVATNADATYPTPDGLLPGAGSILASVEFATGKKASVAGKPYPPVVDLLKARAGEIALVVGDRLDTDGLLAKRLGVTFGLVLTGVTREAPAPDPMITVSASLEEIVAARLGGH